MKCDICCEAYRLLKGVASATTGPSVMLLLWLQCSKFSKSYINLRSLAAEGSPVVEGNLVGGTLVVDSFAADTLAGDSPVAVAGRNQSKTPQK